MDYARLANETVSRLAPYLARLLSLYVPGSNASKREKEAFDLWQMIYPKIALRSRVIHAARQMSVENNSENREAFVRQLTQVFRTNEHIANQVRNLIHNGIPEESDPSTITKTSQQTGAGAQEFGAEQIACQVCGSQDETLRLVSYPYVFSVIIITFRRVFQGVYCSRHANRYFFLAALITLTIGWMGIPFGILFTPITLFNLLRAEKGLRPANAKILLEIAKSKFEAGNPEEAAAYIKEALWLENTTQTRSRVKVMGLDLDIPEQPGVFRQVAIILGVLVTTWLMGMLIGLIDGVVTTPFYGLEENVSVLVIIFSYIPLLLMLFFTGFVAARLAADAVQHSALRRIWLGRLLGLVLSFEMVYAILSGRFLFSSQMANDAPVMFDDRFFTFGQSVVHGGWQMLVGFLRDPSFLLFGTLVLLAGVLFLWLIQDAISRMVRWRLALDGLTGKFNQESGILAVFGALSLLLGITLILGVLFFPAQIFS